MEFLIVFLIFSMVVRNAFAIPSDSEIRKKRQDFDWDDAESFIDSLSSLSFDDDVPHGYHDVSAFPHEDLHEFNSYALPAHSYGLPESAAVAVPTLGVGINVDKHAVLQPHIELIRFLEAFLQFKTELIARLQHLLNDNWDLIISITNLVLGKLQNLQGFSLIFISILRQILEFALGLFSYFNINLPSIRVGVSGHVDQLPSFNLNSMISAVNDWLS
ncbi:hypothetical protein FQR65_LT03182 [Abscondita terminalis]|nr:hypothetical protein FQR65_LT03182 [Abscondita terminalis]